MPVSDAAANLTPLNIATIDAIVSLFETNSPARYGAVARSATDAGGLSYGKHQAALVGGHLFQLISQYCSAPGAVQANDLKPYLDRMQASDRSLDHGGVRRQLCRRRHEREKVAPDLRRLLSWLRVAHDGNWP